MPGALGFVFGTRQQVSDQRFLTLVEGVIDLFVLLEAIGEIGELCNSGDMLHNPRRDSRPVREVPQPLKGLEYTTWKVSSFAGRQGLRLSGWHQHLQYFITGFALGKISLA